MLSVYLLALSIGIVAGLRAMTAPAAISWAAHLGALKLGGTWLAFLGFTWTPWIITLFAIGELINDQLPNTPSRKVPAQFGARIVMGAVSGAAIGAGVAGSSWVFGLVICAIGAVIGTLGGAAVRGRLAAAFGRDLPAALIEDFVAIAAAAAIVKALA
jgi:uncharacterized membrane protein